MDVLNVYFNVLDDKTIPILKDLRKNRCKAVRCWFKKNDKDKILYLRDYNTIEHNQTDKDLTCYNWDIYNCEVLPEFNGVEHLLWRILNENTPFVCIDNRSHCNNQLSLFHDAKHKDEYPNQFVKVPCFTTLGGLMEYAQNFGVFSFSLQDGTNFDKCNNISPIQGATVFRNKKTGYYWYMDMFHKNHYEVFDKTGVHLGEADMNGTLDTSKKDSKKRISVQ